MTDQKEEFIIVLCTVPDEKTALHLSRIVVEEKLAACCNIIPAVKSIYFWKDQRQEDSELLMIIKTRRDAFNPLQKRIRSEHPYTVPEIIALPMVDGNDDYLKWVNENVQKR